MATGPKGEIFAAWRHVFAGNFRDMGFTVSRDGRSFSKPARVPTFGSPKPSHPQVVVDGKGGIAVAWDEVVDGRRVAAVRRAKADLR